MKYTDKRETKNKGITLISLVVTIIVLLILAGISIVALTGDNGIIGQAQGAKSQAEIDEEEEILDLATIDAMGKHKRGELTLENLINSLNNYSNGLEIKVVDNGDGTFTVTFPSGSVFLVDEEGNIEYLGTQKELVEKVTITADKESNSTREFVQTVELTVNTYYPVENADIALLYGWTTSDKQEPTEYMTASLTGSKLNRTAIVSSTVTTEGNYYLWVKVIVNGKETTKIFGTYAIREFTTLKVCSSSDGNASSYFLGSDKVNTNITRNAIKSIEIEDSLEGYSTSNSNCWDVSEKQDGSILASYEEVTIDGNTYYDVKIASDGKVAANPNSNYLFKNIGYGFNDEVTITGLNNLDTSFVTSMNNMFACINNLASLDVSNFDTGKVTNFCGMFGKCSSLMTLNLSRFDTNTAKSMDYMFNDCTKLEKLDLSNFDTRNVTNMKYMFNNCSKLTNLDLSNFDTSNVTDMIYMFNGCSSLTNLDISEFETNSSTSFYCMFNGCSSLIKLDVSNFNTSNVTTTTAMFSGCSKLTTLDLSNFNTSNVKTMNTMFKGCSSLVDVDVSSFDTSNTENMNSMFSECSSLKSLDVTNFNTANVTTMGNMFDGCSSLKKLDVTNFNTSNVKSMGSMFRGCSGLTSLDVTNFNTLNVTSMREMFDGCSGLTSLDLTKFNTSSVTTMFEMFIGCRGLTSLDLSSFSTINVNTMYFMFTDCTSLEEIDLSSFDTKNVTTMTNMFRYCNALTSLDISNFEIGEDVSIHAMFYGNRGTYNIYVGTEEIQKRIIAQNSYFSTNNVIVKTTQEEV